MKDSRAFIERLSGLAHLSAELKEELAFSLVAEHYRSHQVIHATGQVETRFWYIAEGLVRTYDFDLSGREQTFAFFRHQDLLFSFEGYWKEKSNHYIEVLETSMLVSLSYEHLHALLTRFPEMQDLVKIFVRQYLHQERYRHHLLTLTAKERYLHLRKSRPELFRHVSVRLLATYLHITRESLSRLMGRD